MQTSLWHGKAARIAPCTERPRSRPLCRQCARSRPRCIAVHRRRERGSRKSWLDSCRASAL